MSLLTTFSKVLEKSGFLKGDLIVAVSGGVDSVVLCHLLHVNNIRFDVAHCNFRLRGEESDADEAFVRKLAEKYHASFFLQRFDTKRTAEKNKISIQMAARDLRYSWFRSLHHSYILTAHHLNDNVETILINLFNGCGINGLTGMEYINERIYRPLLFADKNDIINYATENKLDYRTDSSNIDNKYKRNFIRNEVIPLVQKHFPQLTDNISRSIAIFKDEEILLKKSSADYAKKIVHTDGTFIKLSISELQATPAVKTVLYNILQPYGFRSSQLGDLMRLMNTTSGKQIFSKEYKILKDRGFLVVSRNNKDTPPLFMIENEKTFVFTAGSISFHYSNPTTENVQQTIEVDAQKLIFPLTLRRWQNGDFFFPKGMKNKKKVSRFLIDKKYSLYDKENLWVLTSNNNIVWLVNERVDERFVPDSNTQQTIFIQFSTL